jgi:putative FmdB family regulatory protein
MPIYEYQCEKCKKTEERLRKLSDESLVECIDCNQPMVKILGVTEFRLRGKGWYETDFKQSDRRRMSTKDN